MKSYLVTLALAVLAIGARANGLPHVNLDPDTISVSGISAGAFQAVQMGVAYSSVFKSIGVVAGGPFYCAQDNVELALSSCMSTPALISASELAAVTLNTAGYGFVDPVSNLHSSRIFLYSGTKDTVVDTGVVESLRSYLTHFLPGDNIRTQYNVPSEHAMITADYGNACGHLGEPFINNCGFDLVSEMLGWMTGVNASAPLAAAAGEFTEFDQDTFLPAGWIANAAGLAHTGVVYVPPQCAGGAKRCHLHVAFHGCKQTMEDVQDKYYRHAGYNNWADAHDTVILYPQASANTFNPQGCWDWWGFTGSAYASNAGVQPTTILSIMSALVGSPLGIGTAPKPGADPSSAFKPSAEAKVALTASALAYQEAVVDRQGPDAALLAALRATPTSPVEEVTQGATMLRRR